MSTARRAYRVRSARLGVTRAREALVVGKSYLGVVMGEVAYLTVETIRPDGAICQHRGHGRVLVTDDAPMLPAVTKRGLVRLEGVLPVLEHTIA